MSSNAAIYYEDDAFKIDVPKLMGRQMAGSGFLHGFLKHGEADQLYVYATHERAAHSFRATASGYGSKPVSWISPARLDKLSEPGCLFVPGPGLDDYAWQRLRHGERAYSLCGVTHTTASHRVMDVLANMLVAPVRPWDAVICTSRAVRDTAKVVLESQAEYLRWRLGATIRAEGPQLPLIPLGVDCTRLQPDRKRRAAARKRLGIGDADIAVLFVGRLSFHAKAHPQPMYLGLERASRGRKVHMIQTGWFANDHIEAAYRDGAKALCPSVNAIFVDGRNQEHALDTWAAADVFASLSDNIQETFGLTPVEAMACGLPVVASDWDGYRDTVRDGIDGILVPTLTPDAPLGEPFAMRHETGIDNYDKYCGHTSQFTSVDTGACAQAFERLFADPALRRRMGDAGLARAREVYDWRVIVRRYQALWAELSERRRADAGFADRPAPACRPGREDPFRLFASYPSSRLGPQHRVRMVPGADAAMLEARRALAFNVYANQVLPPAAMCASLIAALIERGESSVGDFIAAVPAKARDDAMRALVWMAKMDIVAIDSPGQA